MKCPPIGIMQGRLSPPAGAAIQAFPAGHWAEEFPAAQAAGLCCIEWIYDIGGDDVNPLCTGGGRARMRELASRHHVAVESVCADYFMAEPLLKGTAEERATRREKLVWLLACCRELEIRRVILPFVDASKIEDARQARELARLLSGLGEEAGGHPEIHLETSLEPARFSELLRDIDLPWVKVNYDSGNSSSLGYDADKEFTAYGGLIGSVHIKDRVLGGGTVPLGKGNADFPKLISNLERISYRGSIILQVARSESGGEIEWARGNRQIVQSWFEPPG